MFYFDIEKILQSGGILAVGIIVFAESGLLAGFFLPGDTLLLFAGFFAAQSKLPILGLVVTVVVAAIVGDNVGYSIGRRAGPRIFRKKDGIFFRHEHIEKAERFYEIHGGKTIILARFLPVIRTFAPLVAGIGKMPRNRFVLYNIMGGIFWGAGVTLIGYFAGGFIAPSTIEKFILPLAIIVMLCTFGPAFYHLLKDQKARDILKVKLRRILQILVLNKRVK